MNLGLSRLFLPLLILTFVLGACAPHPSLPASQAAPPPSMIPFPTSETSSVSSVPTTESTISTPPVDQSPDTNVTEIAPTDSSCGYQWAYQDLPDLSTEFQQAIQELQPEAIAKAYLFGEDCIHSDGSKTFLAKETDFNITLQINELGNENELGEWIVKVMQIILNIPREKIVGPVPGLVRIVFQAEDQNLGVSFYIDRYRALPSGLSNTEIYQALKTPQ